jgi:hypothetical protein
MFLEVEPHVTTKDSLRKRIRVFKFKNDFIIPKTKDKLTSKSNSFETSPFTDEAIDEELEIKLSARFGVNWE